MLLKAAEKEEGVSEKDKVKIYGTHRGIESIAMARVRSSRSYAICM